MRVAHVERPDARGMVCRAGGKVTDVGGEEDAGDICLMGDEFTDRDERGGVTILNHAPNVDIALEGMSAEL